MNQSDINEYRQVWDNRYGNEEYAYGKQPNAFFAAQLEKLSAGRILMPADGEGRNGVYAATKGWDVTACDLSAAGKTKALELAGECGVNIDYVVGDLMDLNFPEGHFDAIGLIYAHFPADVKSKLHHKLITLLQPGGIVLFEAFSKNHIPFVTANPKVGGPKNIDMLFSAEEVAADFAGFDTILLTEEVVMLEEGAYHVGEGSVIRFVGRKPL